MWRASEQAVVAAELRRRPGVLDLEVNAVAQSATVTFDPAATAVTPCPWTRWSPTCATASLSLRPRTRVAEPVREGPRSHGKGQVALLRQGVGAGNGATSDDRRSRAS